MIKFTGKAKYSEKIRSGYLVGDNEAHYITQWSDQLNNFAMFMVESDSIQLHFTSHRTWWQLLSDPVRIALACDYGHGKRSVGSLTDNEIKEMYEHYEGKDYVTDF